MRIYCLLTPPPPPPPAPPPPLSRPSSWLLCTLARYFIFISVRSTPTTARCCRFIGNAVRHRPVVVLLECDGCQCRYVCHVSPVQRLGSCGDGNGVVAVSWLGGWNGRKQGGGFGAYMVSLVQRDDVDFGGPVAATHTHQGSASSVQIIELSPRDVTQPYSIVVTPCWVTSQTKRCFSEFSSATGLQYSVRQSLDSTWVVRFSPSAATGISQSFTFTTQCSSLQFQASFNLVALASLKSSYPESKTSSLFSRHISHIVSVFSNVSLTSHLSISCVRFSDVGHACGCTTTVPQAWRSNISSVLSSIGAGSNALVMLPQDDNSVLFVGVICGNESNVNVSVVVVPLPFSNSLLMLQLNSISASIQLPFTVAGNFSSGQVSFATSSSSSANMMVDFMSSTLHCADPSTISAAVASVVTGVRPVIFPLQIDKAVFAFTPSNRAVTADACWSRVMLSESISGQHIIVDGSWSLFDRSQSWGAMRVVLQTSGSSAVHLKRDTSVSAVALVGSMVTIAAACTTPSCVVTWVISKHFDIDITNSSSGQSGRFIPRPHHGGGKFRVR